MVVSNPGDRWRRAWLLLVAALVAAVALLLARCTSDNDNRIAGLAAKPLGTPPVTQATPDPATTLLVPTPTELQTDVPAVDPDATAPRATDPPTTEPPTTEPPTTEPPTTEPPTTVAPAPVDTTTTLAPEAVETVQAIADEIKLDGIQFVTGSAELTPAATGTLDKVADTLNAHPDVKVEIGGHTDNTGVAARNLTLSQQRADAVLSYLVSKSVDTSRLTAVGYGQDRPIDENATDAGRARNRRIEFTPA
jgi:outer membrane protein OmpA-like peptidoglycan-associated protein